MTDPITWTPTGDGDEETATLGDLALFVETNKADGVPPARWLLRRPHRGEIGDGFVAYGRAKSLAAAKALAEFAARLEAGEAEPRYEVVGLRYDIRAPSRSCVEECNGPGEWERWTRRDDGGVLVEREVTRG